MIPGNTDAPSSSLRVDAARPSVEFMASSGNYMFVMVGEDDVPMYEAEFFKEKVRNCVVCLSTLPISLMHVCCAAVSA